ncbi:MAG: GAF domain-containing protein [Planctomycetota bacterium]|nr:GAF domain-containing protein [Planctomycetota bacterium]
MGKASLEVTRRKSPRKPRAATPPPEVTEPLEPVALPSPPPPIADHVTSLTSISEAMGTDKSPKEILQLILKSAFSITRASSASLMLLEPGTDVLRVEVAEGFKDDSIYKTRLRVGQGVTGWVAETGVPLRVGNVTKDPRYVRVQRGLRSELAVPLKVGGSVIGVISCDSTRLNHFTPEDEALVISLAAHSARVIQTTRLYEETRRRAEELRLLIEAGRVLAGTLDLQLVLGQLVEQAAKFWRAPVAAVYLVSDDGKNFTLAASHGGSEAWRGQSPIPIEDAFVGQAMVSNEETTVFENLGAAGIDDRARAQLPPEAGALLAAPLVAKRRALGVLCVFGRSGRKITKDERGLLAGLAASASLAIENANAHRRMLAAEEGLRGAEKSTLLAEMASGLAHEIRNPLTSIKLLVDSMVRSQAIKPEAASDATMIQKQIERLEKIVGSYLETARQHVSKMQHKVVDFNAVIEESLLLLATSSHEGLRMDCTLQAEELRVEGDPTQLSQAVYNLVLNAIQAVGQFVKSHPGNGRGRITVLSGRQADRQETFFEVADDGPGMCEEVKDRLFQPFVTTKEQGVGLGLSIVKRIVEAHNGRLEVESPRGDLGRGARFRVVLPSAG